MKTFIYYLFYNKTYSLILGCLYVSKKIIGSNIDDGFTFFVKPSKSGKSKVLTINRDLINTNQIPDEELEVTIRRKKPHYDQEG